MKKLSVLLCAAFVLASCATLFSSHAPKFSFAVTDVYNDGLVEISVPDLETENSLTTGLQVVGLDIQVSNTSSKTLTIKWGDSSVDYNGKSHLIFLKGRFASDAGKRMPDSILRPGSRVTFGVFPADNIPQASQYQEGSKIDPLSSKDFSCGISIDLGGEMRFYKVEIVMEPPPSKQ